MQNSHTASSAASSGQRSTLETAQNAMSSTATGGTSLPELGGSRLGSMPTVSTASGSTSLALTGSDDGTWEGTLQSQSMTAEGDIGDDEYAGEARNQVGSSLIKFGFVGVLVQRPTCFLFLGQMVVCILCASLWRSGTINTDFDSFTRATSSASLQYDAYNHAWQRSEFSPTQGARRLETQPDAAVKQASEVPYVHKMFHIMYFKEGGNLLEEKHLYAIAAFEKRLRALPEWQSLCHENEHAKGLTCDPGESFINYIYPEILADTEAISRSASGGIGEQLRERLDLAEAEGLQNIDQDLPNEATRHLKGLRFNGRGTRMLSVDLTILALRAREEPVDSIKRMFPKDATLPTDSTESAATDALRSAFLFSLARGEGWKYSNGQEASSAWDSFSQGPVREALKSWGVGEGIQVFYYSIELDSADLFDELWNDCKLAIGSILLILLVMYLHTRSVCLSLVGLLLIVESIPLGYVFYKHFSGLPDMSIVNCLSIFVIVGIGSDFLFVLSDGWSYSACLPASDVCTGHTYEVDETAPRYESQLEGRLIWLWWNSGSSCATTSLCASSSFFMNMLSVLLPLREFGLFMGLCVMFSFLLMVSMYPVALIAREWWNKVPNDTATSAPVTHKVVVPEPPVEASRSQMQSKMSMRHADMESRLVRFMAGPWSKLLDKHRYTILAFFGAIALVCLISVPLTIGVSGDVPEIFPADHNQVAGKALKARFADGVMISKVTTLEDSWMCDLDISREDREQCVDVDLSCSTWASVGLCPAIFQKCRQTCGNCGYCFARWCQVDTAFSSAATKELGQCHCYEIGANDLQSQVGGSAQAIFETTFVGVNSSALSTLGQPLLKLIMEISNSSETQISKEKDAFDLAPLAQEHWRSGALTVWQAFQAPTYRINSNKLGNNVRKIKQVCYCDGVPPCFSTTVAHRILYHMDFGHSQLQWGDAQDVSSEAPAGRRVEEKLWGDSMAPMIPSFTMKPARRLASRTGHVRVIWGLLTKGLSSGDLFVQTQVTQMWTFDPMFDPADPWSQRAFLNMYEKMPVERLGVIAANPGDAEETPWVLAFEQWLLKTHNSLYPSRDFHVSIRQFLDDTMGSPYEEVFLIDGTTIKALRLDFQVTDRNVDDPMELKSRWDEYLGASNRAANIHANRAIHVSSIWVGAEAQSGIVSSTALSIALSIIFGFIVIALFSKDVWLAALCMVSITAVILCQLFIMVVVAGWSLGPVEVIALIVFLGYMFTFNLHIAHAYSHAHEDAAKSSDAQADQAVVPRSIDGFRPDGLALENTSRLDSLKHCCSWELVGSHIDRRTGVSFALAVMGRSIMASAATTTGCSMFLLFATLRFFVRFGVVIVVITSLAMVYALAFLPTVLLVVGPSPESACSLVRWRKFLFKSRGKKEHPHVEEEPCPSTNQENEEEDSQNALDDAAKPHNRQGGRDPSPNAGSLACVAGRVIDETRESSCRQEGAFNVAIEEQAEETAPDRLPYPDGQGLPSQESSETAALRLNIE